MSGDNDIRRLSVLLEILTECSRLTAVDALTRVVGARLRWVIDFRRCVLILGDDSGAPLRFMAAEAGGQRLLSPAEFAPEELELVRRALASRRIQVDGQGAPSSLCAPLESSGRLLGALWLSALPGMAYTHADFRIALFLSDFIAGTLERIQQADTIAQQRQVESELRETQRMLTQALMTRDEFLSIASHELKTPLTSLKLQNQIRRRALAKSSNSFSPEKVAKILDDDGRHIQRLVHLVDEMLDLSRLNAGKLELVREPMDLCLVVQELIERFSSSFEAAGCELTVAYQGPVMGVWDRSRIEQVVLNLMTNAMKYGAGKPVSIRVAEEGGHGLFVIQDQGVGIAQEDHHRIFHQFERAQTGRHLQGLGLGLYITAQIVAAHSGAIGLQSEVGRGATFTVKLPVAAS